MEGTGEIPIQPVQPAPIAEVKPAVSAQVAGTEALKAATPITPLIEHQAPTQEQYKPVSMQNWLNMSSDAKQAMIDNKPLGMPDNQYKQWLEDVKEFRAIDVARRAERQSERAKLIPTREQRIQREQDALEKGNAAFLAEITTTAPTTPQNSEDAPGVAQRLAILRDINTPDGEVKAKKELQNILNVQAEAAKELETTEETPDMVVAPLKPEDSEQKVTDWKNRLADWQKQQEQQ